MLFLPGAVLFAINSDWALQKVYAGNTVCTSNHTDWYTSVIGETPCTTYERLRQICNSAYQVGTLTRNTPPDHCDDQVQDCCCNSISFALSMLCLACQDNTADGFDAGVGAYQQYLIRGEGVCNPRKDQNFTTTIQNAVCNSGLKIEDQLYNLFWNDGAWFYAYTRDSIIRDHAAFSNKTQTKCLTITSSSTLPSSTFRPSSDTSSPTTTPSSSGPGRDGSTDNDSELGSGAIAGIVVGVAAIVALLLIIFILVSRHRRVRAAAARREIDPYTTNGQGIVHSRYEPVGATSSESPSDGDENTVFPLKIVPAQKRGRRQNPHSSISNTNTSGSGSESGYTPHGSSMTVGLDHNRLTGPAERHTDAGPVLGPELGRSNSGRLPPAYGEQLTLTGPTNLTIGARPQVLLSYTPPEERHAQFESDYAKAPSSELGAQNGTTSMQEVGNLLPSASPLVPVRRKE